jgi:hypothetical protein
MSPARWWPYQTGTLTADAGRQKAALIETRAPGVLLWRNRPGDREQADGLLAPVQAAYGPLGMRRHVTLAEAMAAESGNPIAR